MKRLNRGLKSLAGIALALPLAFGGALQAQTLHAFMVGDTIDRNIGPSDRIDMNKMTQLVRTAAENSGMQLNLVSYMDRALPRQEIMTRIQNLRPGPDDTVFFYYTGHGYRTRNMTTGWPAMALDNYQGLDEMWVYNTLKAQRPRLLIVLMDACNGVASIPDTVLATRTLGNADNYRALFREARGGYIMSSSKPGEYSWADNTNGSYWTNQFLRVFTAAVGSPQTPSWDNIVRQAAAVIRGGDDVMTPQYAIQQISDSGSPVALTADGQTTIADNNDPAPPGPPSPDIGGESGSLGGLILKLEESIKWEAQERDWQSVRGNWLAKVRNSNDSLATLREAVLELERSVRYNAQDPSWRNDRPAWLSGVQSANSKSQLRDLILKFEQSIKWESQYEEWQDERDGWLSEMQSVSYGPESQALLAA
ncbi:MAG: caspase family protein [Spirochaetales bacterium]|nr:caspase family protein [Leptospiraceae bacterium]MCP5482434.1 caspase family protein [Spirochaetales bacterium]MCP5485862.1 caspase family protein [Spirochaetales bacterium]